MNSRDDFPAPVRRTLALRAAHFCSNPDCLRLTTGPHSNPAKALVTGHAAHIHAASPLGPRYNPKQTTEQRKAARNGIWLCRECGQIVDGDTSAHTAPQLRRWKRDHEALVATIRTRGYEASIRLMNGNSFGRADAKKLIAKL